MDDTVMHNAQSLASLTSLSRGVSLDDGFDGLGFAFPGKKAEGASAGLGASTSAAPLISAPVARQTAEFQTAIAPPTRPSNPAIAPPTTGNDANAMNGTGASPGSAMEKLAYIAEIRLQMAGSQSNGPSGNRKEILASIN